MLRKARSLYVLAWAPGGSNCWRLDAGKAKTTAQQPVRKEKLGRIEKGTLEPMVLLCAGDVLQCAGRKTLLQVGTGKPGYEVKRLGNWGSCSAWGPCKNGMWVVVWRDGGAILNERGGAQILPTENKWNPHYLCKMGGNSLTHFFLSPLLAGIWGETESFVHLIAGPWEKSSYLDF